MPAIQIDKDGLMPINKMWRLILRIIYDPAHAGESDLWLINQNHEKWYAIVMVHNKQILDAMGDAALKEEIGRRGTVVDEIEYQLKKMADYLVADEKGILEDSPVGELLSKKAVREHGIDYRKMFPAVFPECRPTNRDLARAKELGRINDEENRDLINNN